MNVKSKLKNSLFASVSLIALGTITPATTFAAATNLSTNPNTGATNNDGYVLDAAFTLTSGTLSDAGSSTTNVVTMNNATAYTLTVNSGATISISKLGVNGHYVIESKGAVNAASAIVNSGTIKSLSEDLDRTIVISSPIASITNNAGGLIQSFNGFTVVLDAAITSGIVNNGTIKALSGGGGSGILLQGGGAGTITNGGLIQGLTNSAIYSNVANSTNIINTGTLETTNGGIVITVASGTLTGYIQNNSTGIIRAITDGNTIDTNQTISGGIINSGTIQSAGTTTSSAIRLTASKTVAITNNTGGVITSIGTQATIFDSTTLTHTGAISNAGTVSNTRTGALGDAIAVSTLANGLSNTGTISTTATGAAAAIRVTAVSASGITNTGGTITSYGTDGTVKLTGDNDIVGDITNTGTIQNLNVTATSRVAIDLSSQTTIGKAIAVINSGTISGQIKLGNADTVTQTAGSMTGSGSSVLLGGTTSGTITIAGTVSNTSVGGTGDAISVTTLSNGLANTGTISSTATGAAAAIRLAATSASGITNTGGTITSYGTDGTITLSADADIVGDITNTGTIQSLHTTGANRVALDLSAQTTTGNAITVTNSGTITGKVKLGKADIFTQNSGSTTVSSGTAILGTSTGNETLNLNAGSVAGDIDLGGTDSDTINFGAASGNIFTTGGTIAAGILDIKFGTVNVGHAITLAGATKSITVANGAIMDFTSSQTHTASTVTNHGTMIIDAGVTVTTASAITIDAGTLKIAATSATNYGKLIGSGITLSNSGSIYIDAATLGSGLSGKTINIFQGTSSAPVGFTDGALLADNHSLYKFTTQISGNDVNAVIGYSVPLASAAPSTASAATAAALDSVVTGINPALDTIISTINSYDTDAQKDAAIKTLAPDTSGATSQSAASIGEVAVSTIETHMESARADMDGTGIATGDESNNRAVWGKAFGGEVTQGYRRGVDGYKAKIGGIALGFDAAIKDNARVGIAYTYGQSNSKSTNSKGQVDAYQLTIYGTYNTGQIYYEASGAAAINTYDNERTIFDGSVANANYKGNQYSLKAAGGYKVKLYNNYLLTPFLSMQYSRVSQENYIETGTDAYLTVTNKDLDILKSGLGIKFSDSIKYSNIKYAPKISLAWYHDFIGDVSETSSVFASGAPFKSKGASVSRDTFALGTGLDLLSHDSLSVSIDYNFEARENFRSHTGLLNIRKEF